MSDLNPKGVEMQVDGETRRLLFTFNAVDKIESDMDSPLYEVLQGLSRPESLRPLLRYLVLVLLNDEAKRVKRFEGRELPEYTEEDLGWILTLDNRDEWVDKVLDAYLLSMPKADDDDPNQ